MMKINGFTAFLVFQLCAVLIVISLAVFRPRPWSAARWTGLGIAVPAAVLLFVARWQLGRSFSVTPQARQLVTHGLYSKIRNPNLCFQRPDVGRNRNRAGKAIRTVVSARSDSCSGSPRKQRGQSPRSKVRRRISRVQGKDLVLMQKHQAM